MGLESATPKARRKAAESELAARHDVVGMLVNIKADSKVTRLGVDPNNFLNFKASTFEMFVASTRSWAVCLEWSQCSRWRSTAL